MGGYGSGFRGISKRTVEGCLILSTAKLMSLRMLEPNCSCRNGCVTWTNTYTGEKVASIGIDTDADNESGSVTLRYTRKDAGESMDYRVNITPTPLPWGGLRWWFICPLTVNGRHCGRRVGKLYLPNGARYFGCRRCYDLTYTSCHESHKYDRCLAELGREVGLSGREVAEVLSRRNR
jgi:hypothetical protein